MRRCPVSRWKSKPVAKLRASDRRQGDMKSDEADIAEIGEVMATIPPPLSLPDGRSRDRYSSGRKRGRHQERLHQRGAFSRTFPAQAVMRGCCWSRPCADGRGSGGQDDGRTCARKLVYFMTIDNARFAAAGGAGRQVRIEVAVRRHRGAVWRFAPRRSSMARSRPRPNTAP